MDEFSQIGPDKGHYDQDVKSIADALRYPERAVTFALTHRMTRQQLVVVLKDAMELVAPPAGCTEGVWAFVAVVEKGAYWFRIDHLVEPSYIASKLGIHLVDATTISDLLRRLALALDVTPVRARSVVTELHPGAA